MHNVPVQRFAGSVLAFGAYGPPALASFRVSRRTLLIFGLMGVLLTLFAAGAIHPGGLLLAAGPVATGAAADIREKALAKLLEAKALEEPDGTVKAESRERQAAIMAEFAQLDADAGSAEQSGTVRERLEWYQTRATGSPMRWQRTQTDPNAGKSAGQQFVDSDAYKKLRESGALRSDSSVFRSDPVILGGRIPMGAAAGDVIQTESGGPGAGLVTPYYLPNVLALPQRPTVVRALFANENMPAGDTISYAAQTGFDNAAAAVAQATSAAGTGLTGGVKPQSSIAWQRKTAEAEYIATWMAATRQGLDDPNQMRSLIDNQGRLMIALAEDDQLVNGNGTAPNISGILDQSALQTLDLTGEDNLDGVRTGRRLVKTGTSRLDPTFIITNPIDSEEFDLLKNAQGEYRGGNPIGNFGFSQPIWGLQRVESEAVAEGTAIIGARAAATVFERQPLTVLTADQHADFFVRNLVVILFEERLAFPVYFPTGFVEVTLADW